MPRQRLLVRNSDRFADLALAWLLTEQARSDWERSPHGALEYLTTAELILDRLPASQRTARSGIDVLALHRAYRANCRRILSDHRGAEEDFRAALERLRSQPDEASENHAILWELWTSLRQEQQRFDEAAVLIARAQDLYERIGDLASLARTRITEARTLRGLGRSQEALDVLDALVAGPLWELLDGRTRFMTFNNRLVYRVDLGDHLEALRELPRLRELAAGFADDFQVIRVDWLQGTIEEKAGLTDAAVTSYERVMGFYLRHRLPFDAAVVSLDLTALLLRTGRLRQARELAASVVPVFEAQELPRYSLAALSLFFEAVRSVQATVSMAHEVEAFLQRARLRPEEPFVPSAAFQS